MLRPYIVLFVSSFENTCAGMICRMKNPDLALLRLKEPLGSVIPAKAGIQVNSAEQTWIPAPRFRGGRLRAGMTSRGEHYVEGNPSIFMFSGRA